VSIGGPQGPGAVFSGTYTVGAGDTSGDLDSTTIALSAGTVRDGAGNDAVIALPATTIADGVSDRDRYGCAQYQQASPPVRPTGRTTGDGIDVTVTFSESVSLDGAGVLEITLDTGDVVSIAGPQGPGAVFSGTYTVGAGDTSGDLDSTT